MRKKRSRRWCFMCCSIVFVLTKGVSAWMLKLFWGVIMWKSLWSRQYFHIHIMKPFEWMSDKALYLLFSTQSSTMVMLFRFSSVFLAFWINQNVAIGFHHIVIHPSTRQLVFVGTSCWADPVHKIPSSAQNHQSTWGNPTHTGVTIRRPLLLVWRALLTAAGCIVDSLRVWIQIKMWEIFRGICGLVTIRLEKMWFI